MKDELLYLIIGSPFIIFGSVAYFLLDALINPYISYLLMIAGTLTLSFSFYFWRLKTTAPIHHVIPKGLMKWNLIFLMIFTGIFILLTFNIYLISELINVVFIYYIFFMIASIISYPFRGDVKNIIGKRMILGIIGMGLLIITPFMNWISVDVIGYTYIPMGLDFLGLHNAGSVSLIISQLRLDTSIGMILMLVIFSIPLSCTATLIDPEFKDEPKKIGNILLKKALVLLILIITIIIVMGVLIPLLFALMLIPMGLPLLLSPVIIIPDLGMILAGFCIVLLTISGYLLKNFDDSEYKRNL